MAPLLRLDVDHGPTTGIHLAAGVSLEPEDRATPTRSLRRRLQRGTLLALLFGQACLFGGMSKAQDGTVVPGEALPAAVTSPLTTPEPGGAPSENSPADGLQPAIPQAGVPQPQPAPGTTPAPAPPAKTPTTGLVTIESDLQQADNRTGVITATGNVRIVYPDERVVATARQAQYFSQEGLVILSGDVDVIQSDGHSIKAERVYYWVENERVKAEPTGGQQVFSKLKVDALQKPQAVAPGTEGTAKSPDSTPVQSGPAESSSSANQP